ncbi:uncharacterized protein LOC112694981 [Athalia rosae]|uniref:uncharacterized protein LOC112694981 n=1 Tax=Athalia rosae TaxID=37344 RepID=UPI0020346B26|nr:uncharacterized protein LOC112694981 [Athalia rosae]
MRPTAVPGSERTPPGYLGHGNCATLSVPQLYGGYRHRGIQQFPRGIDDRKMVVGPGASRSPAETGAQGCRRLPLAHSEGAARSLAERTLIMAAGSTRNGRHFVVTLDAPADDAIAVGSFSRCIGSLRLDSLGKTSRLKTEERKI